ncbi:MAG: hypothetical protein J3K34DRAFT_409809 [Monoraphidium minutum]|nr:MAG: hypothetical protein J3K34DRAFT_409809 [Monoraphidium minutum]
MLAGCLLARALRARMPLAHARTYAHTRTFHKPVAHPQTLCCAAADCRQPQEWRRAPRTLNPDYIRGPWRGRRVFPGSLASSRRLATACSTLSMGDGAASRAPVLSPVPAAALGGRFCPASGGAPHRCVPIPSSCLPCRLLPFQLPSPRSCPAFPRLALATDEGRPHQHQPIFRSRLSAIRAAARAPLASAPPLEPASLHTAKPGLVGSARDAALALRLSNTGHLAPDLAPRHAPCSLNTRPQAHTRDCPDPRPPLSARPHPLRARTRPSGPNPASALFLLRGSGSQRRRL